MNTSTVKQATIQARFLLTHSQSDNDAFSLDIDTVLPGQGVTAIFGQSGSGKTTLLRCIAGLNKADQGRLIVNDEIWQNNSTFVPTHQRALAYVFQESSLFSHLTATGNLRYAIKRSGQATTADFYERVLTTTGIEHILSRYPHQLSGGERQRVAIARALLIQPRLLLMDEPLSSLDNLRKQEILPYLEQLRHHFDIPILYVSHAMSEVTRLADHILLLHKGRVITQGSLTEVCSNLDLPLGLTTHFGEETGVILEGRTVGRDKRWGLARIAFGNAELWLRDDGDMPEKNIRVQILAKDISLTLSEHSDTSILNRLSAQVLAITADRDKSMALVRLKFGYEYLIARLTQKSVHDLQLERGMQVWAQIKSAAVVR